MSAARRLRLAITGTDTGIGKTVVACALTVALRRRGLRVAAMKPIETGVAPDGPRDAASDAARLHRATGGIDAIDDVNPARFAEPLAPWVATMRVGETLDLARLDAARTRLEREADAFIVEGAGGLLVPFTERLTFADLAARWSLDLVIVAANRLGVLNHTLLTVREAERHGLAVCAVVLVAPAIGDVASRSNADALGTLLPATSIVAFPRVADVDNPDALAAAGTALLHSVLDSDSQRPRS